MTDAGRAREAAKRAERGRASERAAFEQRVPAVDQVAISEAMARRVGADGPGRSTRSSTPVPEAFASVDARRWVPIGPAVVRRGQATGRPRVTGRVRDVAIDPFFRRRIYVATAKGGLWYSRDAGATWVPVGGWSAATRTAGGNNSSTSCGCLLVDFDLVDEAQDLVMVGTGEPPSRVRSISAIHPGGRLSDATESTRQRIHGVGVLAAVGPAARAFGTEPWESQTGLALMENTAIYRLVRDPGSQPGKTANPSRDRVLAATSRGVFLGLRTRVPAGGATPAHDEYRWTAITPAGSPLSTSPPVTDAVWLPGANAEGVVLLALAGARAAQQVVSVTNISAAAPTFTTVTGLAPTANSRVSLAPANGNRVYALGENAARTPTLWRVPDVTATPPAATVIPGVPANLWGGQRDYDQALAVDVIAGTDRVYLGGSVVQPAANGSWSASLYAFDVDGVPSLVPAPNVSTQGAPGAAAGNAGADQPGLIGNNLHGDVHRIRTVPHAGGHDVWVTCDGGVYQSTRGGRVNTFAPRSTGLAVLEVGFHAAHPTSSHFGLIGTQDTGSQVRTGDTVWEQTFLADGGGAAFDQVRSQYVVAQNNRGSWRGQPQTGFVSPLNRVGGGGGVAGAYAAERRTAAFYSGCASIASGNTSRMALGTNRVWLSDDIGLRAVNNWAVLGFPNGAATDQGGANNVGVPARAAAPPLGAVPVGTLGPVLRLRWVTPNHLLALYLRGVVRYVQAGNNWTATIVLPGAANAPVFTTRQEIYTDIAPVPGTNDFYLTTSGNPTNVLADTCFFFDSNTGANGTFVATGLRRQLDTPPPANNGPLDPAYSVVVDPSNANDVYVGTVGGIWRGVRGGGAGHPHVWNTEVNGLPEALVQDLTIWADPGGAVAPRLLRAAVQSRGVWEMDLASASEPRRTYVRVHQRDDRRRLPTPMANPRRRPNAPVERFFASPDVVVRPRWPVANAPRWRLGGGTIDQNDRPGYQLWTFQTAFRWRFPSVIADGRWTDQFGDLIEQYRSGIPALAGGGRVIDRALWDNVVGGTRLDAVTNALSTDPADPLAVYRPPWQGFGSPRVEPTEVDLMEAVRPRSVRGHVWRVHNEPVTVDVLIHHRDTRPLAADDAFAVVLWRSRASHSAALGGNVSAFPDFARSLLTAAPDPTPGGWNLVADGAGNVVHRLGVPLDARLPRAVSIDVDLSGVPDWHRVAMVAIVGSNTDPLVSAPSGAVNTLEHLTRRWPHAALRLLQMQPR